MAEYTEDERTSVAVDALIPHARHFAAAMAFGPGFASGSDLGKVDRAAGLLFDAFVAGVRR